MRFIVQIFIFQMLFACTVLAQNNDADILHNALYAGTIEQGDSPKNTIINFLKWYKSNEDRLDKIKVLKGGLQDTASMYYVDFKETETFLSELKKSNFLSGVFLNDLRQSFAGLDKYLKQHPQNDGPVMGFDFDLIMKAQDYMMYGKI